MIDTCDGPFITLSAAAKLPELKRNGQHPHVASLHRWAGPAGVRGVRLQTWQIGGTRCTTVQAVREFIRELTNRTVTRPPAHRPRDGTPVISDAAEVLLRSRTRNSRFSAKPSEQ